MALPTTIDRAYVEQLIAAEVLEGQELEYKRELPRPNHEEQKQTKQDPLEEFAKDVCAMANASGGLMLFGIGEDKEHRPVLDPIPFDLENADDAFRRLQLKLDSLVEPRILGLQFMEIRMDDGYVLALRISASLNGPHWCGNADKRRFKIRRGTTVSEYAYHELRSSFDRNSAAIARAGDWIGEQVEVVRNGYQIMPLLPGPVVVLHAVPMVSYYQAHDPVDVSEVQKNLIKLPRSWFDNGFSANLNFDGVVMFTNRADRGQGDPREGYLQVFRDGSIQSIAVIKSDEVPGLLSPWRVAHSIYEAFTQFPTFLKQVGKDGPMMIGVAMLRVHGHQFRGSDVYEASNKIDRPDLIAPPIYIEHPDDRQCLLVEARNILDMIWQACGLSRCPFFKSNGEWNPHP